MPHKVSYKTSMTGIARYLAPRQDTSNLERYIGRFVTKG